MRTSTTNAGRSALYTVREAAWILGVEPSRVSRAIRLGTLPVVPKRGRVLIPHAALTRLLGEPVDNGGQP